MNKPVVLALIATGLFASSCERSAGHYIAAGDVMAAKGRAEDAILLYRKALQKDPTSGLAYLQLGITQARQARAREAYDALTHAAALLPRDLEPRVRLADLCLALYVLGPEASRPVLDHTCRQMASELEQLQPGGFDALRLKGALAMQDNLPAAAIQLLRRAVDMRPEDHNVAMSLVHALYANGQTEEGRNAGWRLMKSDKAFLPVYDELYVQALKAKDIEEAGRIREEAARNNPASADALLALAEHYYSTHNVSGSESVLDRLSANSATFPDGKLLAGEFFYDRAEWDRAKPHLVEGLRQHPDDVRYSRSLALVLSSQGQRDEAVEILSGFIQRHPKESMIRGLRASILVESGRSADIAAAESEFEDLLKDEPTNPDYLYGLGRARYHQGHYFQSRTLFEEMLQYSSNPTPAWLALGEVSLAMGDAKSALDHAHRVLDRTPDAPLGRLLNAKAAVLDGHTALGIAMLKRLAEENPGLADVTVELGRAYLIAKQFDRAETVFRAAYRAGESDLRIAQGLTSALLAKQKPDQAISLWEVEISRSRDPIVARWNLAETALRINRSDLAIREYGEILSARPSDPSAWLGLARAYQVSGDAKQAMDANQKACELPPASAACHALLGARWSDSGEFLKAATEYRKALQLDPASPVLMNDLAFALAQAGTNLEEADHLAQRAVHLLPAVEATHDTLAWVWIKRNMADAAIPVLRGLVVKKPKQASLRYHLALALAQKGMLNEARIELNNALRCQPTGNEEAAIRAALEQLKS